MSRPFAALSACACAVPLPKWRLFIGVRAVCAARVPLVVVSLFLLPYFSSFLASSVFYLKRKKGGRAYTTQAQAAGAAVQ